MDEFLDDDIQGSILRLRSHEFTGCCIRRFSKIVALTRWSNYRVSRMAYVFQWVAQPQTMWRYFRHDCSTRCDASNSCFVCSCMYVWCATARDTLGGVFTYVHKWYTLCRVYLLFFLCSISALCSLILVTLINFWYFRQICVHNNYIVSVVLLYFISFTKYSFILSFILI